MFRFGKENSTETVLSRRHSFDVLGPIALMLLVFLVFRVIFTAVNLPHVPALALASTIALTAAWFLFRARRRGTKRNQVAELQKQLHELEEKEFELRFEEAKLTGQLNRREQK